MVFAQKGDTRHENHSLPTEIGNAPSSHIAKRRAWNKVMDSITASLAELALKLNVVSWRLIIVQNAPMWANNVAKTGRHWFNCFERKFRKIIRFTILVFLLFRNATSYWLFASRLLANCCLSRFIFTRICWFTCVPWCLSKTSHNSKLLTCTRMFRFSPSSSVARNC